MSEQIVCARIVDGQVVEYPVFPLHIQNRNHPFDWYTKVDFEPKPEVPAFHYLKEVLDVQRISGTQYKVTAKYVITAYTLSQILSTLKKPSGDPLEIIPTPVEPLPISEVPVETVARVAELATKCAQDRLDDFAKTKNYDGIGSAVTYLNSSVPNFAAEAQRAMELRDQTWAAFYAYMGNIQAGVVPVPLTVNEITNNLPELTW